MKKDVCKALFTLLLAPLFLSGCWQEPAAPDTSQLLTEELGGGKQEQPPVLPAAFTLPYAPGQSLDPITCADGMQQVVGGLLYEGLFELDTRLQPQEVLCAGYTYDEASFTYVFSLRAGVTFTDGTVLTAGDAAAALNRARSSARYGARLSKVSSITAGQGTVTVVLTAPSTALPALLDIPIVKAGTESAAVPVGTGPYVFTTDSGGPCLAANAAWWRQEACPVERIGLSAAADQDAMLYQFTSHDVQLMTADLTGTAPVSVTGSISFQDADTTILQYLGFNTQRAPFDSAALRRALGRGLDRESLVSAFLSGHGAAAQAPISPVSALYPSSLDEVYSYDAFAEAMSAAGYASGASRSVTLLVNSENSFKVSAAQAIAQALSVFDLSVEVQSLPWEEYTAALAAGRFDLYYGEVRLTADWDLSPLLSPGGSLNYGGWANPQTEQLLTAFASAQDRAAAAEALCAHLREQSPIVPLCFKSTSVLVQTGVAENLRPTMANPFYAFSSCAIHLRQGG